MSLLEILNGKGLGLKNLLLPPQEAQAVRQLNNDKFTIFKSLIVYYLCVLFAALLHGCVVSH